MFARAFLLGGLSLLIGGAPAVPPLPEVGFWFGGLTSARTASDRPAVIVNFADGTRRRFEPGDDILGWTLVDIRGTADNPADRRVLLSPP